MKRPLSIAAVLLLTCATGFGDIARPAPTETPDAGSGIKTMLSIKLDRNATEARLIIPRSQIKQLRDELESLDDESNNAAAVIEDRPSNRIQTIVSGSLLSLALVFGGFWLVRNGKTATKTGKASVVIMTFAVTAAAASIVWANVGPPPDGRSITGKIFSTAIHKAGFGWGRIKLETADTQDVELIVPNPKP